MAAIAHAATVCKLRTSLRPSPCEKRGYVHPSGSSGSTRREVRTVHHLLSTQQCRASSHEAAYDPRVHGQQDAALFPKPPQDQSRQKLLWTRQAENINKLLRDVVIPAIGVALAFAGFSWADHILHPRGFPVLLGSFGAVACLLLAAPNAPVSKRSTVLIAHFGSSAIAVLSFLLLGSSWLSRSVAVAASMAFMQLFACMHPPAVGLPLIFLDAPKFQQLLWWYTVFPGVIGCIWLFAVQEIVFWLQANLQVKVPSP